MAAALRHALENKALKPWLKLCQPTMAWLAIVGMAVVFAPILPGLIWALMPGLSPSIWHALWINGEWPQALLATLISAGLSSLAALLLAGTIALRASMVEEDNDSALIRFEVEDTGIGIAQADIEKLFGRK